MTNHYHSNRPSPLEIKQLAEFDSDLGDAPEAEKRRKRIVYMQDAVRQTRAGASMLKGFGCMMIPFAIIPIFWPVLIFFWFMRKKATGLWGAQLKTALDYWGLCESDLAAPAPAPSARPTPPPPPPAPGPRLRQTGSVVSEGNRRP